MSSFMNSPLPMWARVSSSVAGASSSAAFVEEVPQKTMLLEMALFFCNTSSKRLRIGALCHVFVCNDCWPF